MSKDDDGYHAYICDDADLLLGYYAVSGADPVHVNYCNKCMYCRPRRRE